MIQSKPSSMAIGFKGTPAKSTGGMAQEYKEKPEVRVEQAFKANDAFLAQRRARLEAKAKREGRM